VRANSEVIKKSWMVPQAPLMSASFGKSRRAWSTSHNCWYVVVCRLSHSIQGDIIVGVIRSRGLVTPPLVFLLQSGSNLSSDAQRLWYRSKYSLRVVRRVATSRVSSAARCFSSAARCPSSAVRCFLFSSASLARNSATVATSSALLDDRQEMDRSGHVSGTEDGMRVGHENS
jgi:hypothetical protein